MTADTVRDSFVEFRTSGSARALARVFDATAQELQLVAWHMGRGRIEPEDLVQSTFLEAIRSADRYDPEQPLMGWLCGILANVARNASRREQRELEVERLTMRSVPNPPLEAEGREFVDAVREAIASLPAPYRDVLSLRLVNGLTPTEIAHSLDKPPGTVKSWIHRGLDLLRRALPPGFAASLAAFVFTGRDLSAVREVVLAAGAAECGRDVAAADTAAKVGPPTGSTAGPAVWTLGGCLLLTATVLFGPWGEDDGADPTHRDAAARGAERSNDPGARTAPSRSPLDVPADGDSGIVLRAAWSDRTPARGVWLHLEPERGPDPRLRDVWVATDDDGRAVIEDLAPGPWRIAIDRAGVHRAVVREGARTRLDLRIPDAAEAVGEVVDERGAPVAAAGIWMCLADRLDQGQVVTVTDSRGRFLVRDAAAGRLVAARAAGFGSSGVHAAHGDGPIRIVLAERGATISGRIVDENGMGVGGARVVVGSTFGPGSEREFCVGLRLRPPWRAVTDRDGAFTFRTIAPNRRLRVYSRAPGHVAAVETIHAPAAGGSGQVAIMLARGGVATGTIRDALGNPGAGVKVRALDDRHLGHSRLDRPPVWVHGETTTEVDGGYELTGLREGPWTIDAELDGHWASAGLRLCNESPQTWSATLGAGVTLSGVVRDDGGRPLPGFRVEAHPAGGPRVPEPVMTRGDGGFAIAGCAQREHVLLAFESGSASPVARAVVGPSSPELLSLVVRSAARPRSAVRGRILGLDGEPASGRVTVSSDAGVEVTAELGTDGAFVAESLTAGTYYVKLDAPQGLRLLHGPVQLAVADVHDCGILREHELGRVRVRVESASDASLDMVFVSVWTDDVAEMPTIVALTDGRATSYPLPAGTYRVTMADARHTVVQEIVAVRPGAVADVHLRAPSGRPVRVRWTQPFHGVTTRLRQTLTDADGHVVWRLNGQRRTVPGAASPEHYRIPPGQYRLTLETPDSAGSAWFDVPEDGPTSDLTVELR